MVVVMREAELLTRDFGLKQLVIQNELTEEQIIGALIEVGLIPLSEYFYQDGEKIWEDD